MSINSLIIKALSPFGYPIEPDLYTGVNKKYFTFKYADERGGNFGDNEPNCTVSYMQIHFFLPITENYLKIKKQIREALFRAGFTYPSITMLTVPEDKIRHIVFECQITEEREEEDMAKVGIEYAIRAKLAEDGTYSGGTTFGPHSTFNGSPTVSDVKDYGDNRTVLADKSVTGGTISIEVNDMANETYAECLGHTIDAEKKTVTCKADDIPPFFGVGAVGTSKRVTGYAYISKWYPKVQFKEPNDENSTKQENITFTHVTLEGDMFQNDAGVWKETAEFDTLAAAKTWLDEKAGIKQPVQP